LQAGYDVKTTSLPSGATMTTGETRPRSGWQANRITIHAMVLVQG
jgi:hypothetical protein